MRSLIALGIRFAALLGVLVLNACGGGSGGPGGGPIPGTPLPPPTQGKYFKRIVIIVQENRSFDNLFARFPGADGATEGKMKVLEGSKYVDKWVKLKPYSLATSVGVEHCYSSFGISYDGGKMDGFNLTRLKDCGEQGPPADKFPYQYVKPAEIRPYWVMAESNVLADHLFQTQGSDSFIAHQDLIRGDTLINSTESIIDTPSNQPWGCDAPPGTTTSLITANNQYRAGAGPYPCLSYRTLRDLLDAQGISWRYYTPKLLYTLGGNLWNAYEAIDAVRHSSEWGTNVVWPEKRALTDSESDSLPSVSWIVPDWGNSDHPGNGSDTGPSWVAQLVNAIGESRAWKKTAILVLWDDWGGMYDHVPPPGARKFGGLGFRVPLIVLSPYAKSGYVSHNPYVFASIVRFIEDNWNLPRLGESDRQANDFVKDFFDFKQSPRPFSPIPAKYSWRYFLRQPSSGKPVDGQ